MFSSSNNKDYNNNNTMSLKDEKSLEDSASMNTDTAPPPPYDYSLGVPQAPRLTPLVKPIALIPGMDAKQQTSLIIEQKIWQMKDVNIPVREAQSGQTILNVQDKVWSIHYRKGISDAQGNLLGTLRASMWKMPCRFYLEDPSGKRILTMISQWSMKPKFNVTFVNPLDGEEVKFEIRIKWSGTLASIVFEGTDTPVAVIHNNNAMGCSWSNKQAYLVTIAQGMDVATTTALVIGLNEISRQYAYASLGSASSAGAAAAAGAGA